MKNLLPTRLNEGGGRGGDMQEIAVAGVGSAIAIYIVNLGLAVMVSDHQGTAKYVQPVQLLLTAMLAAVVVDFMALPLWGIAALAPVQAIQAFTFRRLTADVHTLDDAAAMWPRGTKRRRSTVTASVPVANGKEMRERTPDEVIDQLAELVAKMPKAKRK